MEEILFFLEPESDFADSCIRTKISSKQKKSYPDQAGYEHSGYEASYSLVADIYRTTKCWPNLKFKIFIIRQGYLEENGYHFTNHPEYYKES